MATGAEWNCPICREASDNIAYVRSCRHQFCRPCIVRWATKNPSCPLCRQTVHAIICPAPHDQGFAEMVVSEPSVSRSAGPEESNVAEPQPRTLVAGLPPETWAFLFSNYTETLWPLEMWLNEVVCGVSSWVVAYAKGRIMASLCQYGLHEESLVRGLQPLLQEQTVAFVRQLILTAAELCGEMARLRMGTGPQQPVPQQADPDAVALPGTSGAQEERREGPGQARAATSGAGPSGGSGPGGSRRAGGRRGGGAQERGSRQKPYRRRN